MADRENTTGETSEKTATDETSSAEPTYRDQHNHVVERHADLNDGLVRTMTGISSAALAASVIFLAHLNEPNDPDWMKCLMIGSWVFLLISVALMLRCSQLLINAIELFVSEIYEKKEFMTASDLSDTYKLTVYKADLCRNWGIFFLAVGVLCVIVYAGAHLWQ